jgi:hypothetical protein
MSTMGRLAALQAQLAADIEHAKYSTPGSDASYLVLQLIDILSSGAGTGATKRFAAILSQAGDTSNPTTVANPFNEFGDIHVMGCVRTAEGTYTLTVQDCTDDATKVLLRPYLPPFVVGSEAYVQVALTAENTFTIKVYDAGGSLTDGFSYLLIDFEVLP